MIIRECPDWLVPTGTTTFLWPFSGVGRALGVAYLLWLSTPGCDNRPEAGKEKSPVAIESQLNALVSSMKQVDARLQETQAAVESLQREVDSTREGVLRIQDAGIGALEASLESQWSARMVPLERRLSDLETRTATVVARLDTLVGSSSALEARLAVADSESGRLVRASRVAALAETALAGGRREDAVVLFTSAASLNPSEPSYALRLADVVASDPSVTPEGLSSTATVLRVIALQCPENEVLRLWRAAADLDRRQSDLSRQIADKAAARLQQEMVQETATACSEASELSRLQIRAVPVDQREQRLTELILQVQALDEDACPAVRADCLSTISRWRREIAFDATSVEVCTVLDSIEHELGKGRGAEDITYVQLSAAEQQLRGLARYSEDEVGQVAWGNLQAHQSRFDRIAQRVLEARDESTLKKLAEDVLEAVEFSRTTVNRVGTELQPGGKQYTSSLSELQKRVARVSQVAARLAADSSDKQASPSVESLSRAMNALQDARYRAYCNWARERILAAHVCCENATRGVTDRVFSDEDAKACFDELKSIDPTDLPYALSSAYQKVWEKLVVELPSLMQDRIDSEKYGPEDF